MCADWGTDDNNVKVHPLHRFETIPRRAQLEIPWE